MKNVTILSILLFALIGCSLKPIHIDQVKNIKLIYDEQSPFNYGDTINAKIIALKKNGEELDLSNHRQINFQSNTLNYIAEQQKLYISSKPISKDNTPLAYEIVMTEKDKEKTFKGEVNLNISGSLFVDLRGKAGEDGNNKASRLTRVMLKDGRDGRNGENGDHGENALPLTVHIWKQGQIYFIRSKFEGTDSVYYHKTSNPEGLIIDASGGKGGDGGNGGDGGRGKKGNKSKGFEPGSGGNGGNGGYGGNGGNGAKITVIIHPSAEIITQKINVINQGGRPGLGGAAGQGGQSGKADSGQAQSEEGKAGLVGKAGEPGNSGPSPHIMLKTFDFNNL